MTEPKLYLLGTPYLTIAGQTMEIPRRKVLALLSYLAVTGQPQRRDTLATLLWPESGQSEARAALGRHLSDVRNLLGADAVQSDRETVSLVGNRWLDCHHFAQLLADLNPAPARERLDQAAALYRGDFMTGFTLPDAPAFDEWQFFQREELRQQFGGALTQLIAIHRQQRDYAVALPHARRRLALDTLDEAAHRQVMELYARDGQLSAALRQYELCVQMLAAEFGAPPATETTALYAEIRRGAFNQESTTRQPANSIAPAPHSSPAPSPLLPSAVRHDWHAAPTVDQLYGRESERAAVTGWLLNDRCRLVTIIGPGG